MSQDNAGFSAAKAFISVNQLLRLYLFPDSLFGLCNSLLSTHVKKGHTLVSCVCACMWVLQRESRGVSEAGGLFPPFLRVEKQTGQDKSSIGDQRKTSTFTGSQHQDAT